MAAPELDLMTNAKDGDDDEHPLRCRDDADILLALFEDDDTLSLEVPDDNDAPPLEDSDSDDFELEEDSDDFFNFTPLDVPDTAPIDSDNIHYIWTPLVEYDRNIRLMVLHPADFEDDPIVFSMEVMPLDCAGNYEALSYTWDVARADGSHLTHSILCKYGHPTDQKHQRYRLFKVTLNLFSALQRLRRKLLKGQRSRLWIDALCINQEDSKERSAQVRIMDKIYSRAVLTIFWLGDSLEQEEPGLLKELVRLTAKDAYPPTTFSDKNPLRRLFKTPWFERRWTLQEFAVSSAKMFLAGKHFFSPDSLRKVATAAAIPAPPLLFLSANADHSPPGVTKDTISLLPARPATAATLLHNLITFRETQCSVENDYVFALLGFSCDRRLFGIDYAMSANQLFLFIAQIYIESTAPEYALMVLIWAACSRNGPGAKSLPSWVPDWTNITGDTQDAESAMDALGSTLERVRQSKGQAEDPKIGPLPQNRQLSNDQGIRLNVTLLDNTGQIQGLGLPIFNVDRKFVKILVSHARLIAADVPDGHSVAWLPVWGVAWLIRPAHEKPALHFKLVSNLALPKNMATGLETFSRRVRQFGESTIYLV